MRSPFRGARLEGYHGLKKAQHQEAEVQNCEGKGLLKKGDKVVKCQRCGGTGFR
jgi:DnaJ-class molecular chaperone